MKQLNHFLSETQIVAEAMSEIECPDEATTYYKSKHKQLENDSKLIGDDLDSLFDLSTKERYESKHSILDKITFINRLFETNWDKYVATGYYDNAMRLKLGRFNRLFSNIYRFMQHLGSTHEKSYSFEYLKLRLEKLSKDPNFDGGEEITIKGLDLEKLKKHLAPHFRDSSELYSVLIGNAPSKPLVFKGYSTELMYVFNRLKLEKKIVEGRSDIVKWICKHFLFYDIKKDEVVERKHELMYKQYKEKLDDIPKSNTDIQQLEAFYK